MPRQREGSAPTVLYFANTDWYLYNFRLELAKAARARGAEVLLVSPPGPYVQELEREGFRWIPIEMQRRSLNPARELIVLYRLLKIYRENRPALAHHFTIKCIVYGGIVAKISSLKVVSALTGMGHVYSTHSLKTTILRRFVNILFRIVGGPLTRTIVQNQRDLSIALQEGLTAPDRIHLIEGSGVNTTRFAPITNKDDYPFTVVFVARLLWQKGIGEFVSAAERVRSTHPEIQFVVAGEPDLGNPASVDLEDIEVWRAQGHVKFLGHTKDIVPLFSRAHVAVLPTTYGEGVPRSLIEAAAAGLALIATDHPGCQEIVKNGVNGFLVPPKDVIAIAKAICELYEDRETFGKMSVASRQIAVERFDEQMVIEKTFSVYRELLPDW